MNAFKLVLLFYSTFTLNEFSEKIHVYLLTLGQIAHCPWMLKDCLPLESLTIKTS